MTEPVQKHQVIWLYNYVIDTGASHEDALWEVWREAVKNRPLPEKPGKERARFEKSAEWRAVRYRVLQASNGMCAACGATAITSGRPLHVDHIKPKSKYPELALDIANLQVLCWKCNFGKNTLDHDVWKRQRDTET